MLTLAVAALLVVPATASADDADVLAAFKSHRAEVNGRSAAYARAVKRGSAKGVISADRRIDAALGPAIAALVAAQPSSTTGKRARSCAVREYRMWRHSNMIEIEGLRAYEHGHRRRYRHLLALADANQRRARPYVRCRRHAMAALSRRG